MPTYTADQIVGRTLIARQNIPLKRQPSKLASTIYIAKPGITVGVVYSWVNGDGGIWWLFLDKDQKPYYTFHAPGLYDIQSLNAQGVESLEATQEDKDRAENPLGYYISKFTKPALWIIGGYFVLRAALDLDSHRKTRRR